MNLVALRDLVGLAAFSREGEKLGTVRDVIGDRDSSSECLIIGRRFGRGLVVPVEVVQMTGDRVVVPFTSSFLDMAPRVSEKGTPSSEDCERLRRYYRVDAS